MGFQGTDPRTDLRGAGILGLMHLKALLNQNGAGLVSLQEDLPPELGDPELPLAIASINCSAMLLSHLQLAPKLTCAFLPGGRVECTDSVLHGFLSLGWEGLDDDALTLSAGAPSELIDAAGADAAGAAVRRLQYALQTLHVRLTLHLARAWRRRAADPARTLMDFPLALRETFAHLQRAVRLMGGAPWRLERLIGYLEDETPPQPLLEAASSFSDVAVDCVVRPAAWAVSTAFTLGKGVVETVLGMCFGSAWGAPADDAASNALHDKRQ